MQKLRKLAIAVALLGAFAAPNAFAGGQMVFDPTNYISNAATAAQTLQVETQGIASAIREATMLENQIKNTVNTVENLKGIGSITGDINALQSLWNVDKTLMNQIGGQTQFVQNVMGQFSASGTTGSFTNYVGMLANQSQLGSQNATSLFANYTNMTNEIQSTIQQRQTIAMKNTGALGMNDEIQATNATLDNLSEINQATLQGITTLVRQAAYKQSVDAGQQSAHSNTSSAFDTYMSNGNQAFLNNTTVSHSIMGY
jgi:conjugal transfer/entry exclusion protein